MTIDPSQTAEPLIGIAAIGGFCLFWAALVLLIGRISGWHRLANDFEASHKPTGKAYRMRSIRLGHHSRYSGAINFVVAPEGLYISIMWLFRPGHKPLLIPWEYLLLDQANLSGLNHWLAAEITPKYGGTSVPVIFGEKQFIDALRQHKPAQRHFGD